MLAVNRKLSHSLRVYYRPEDYSHSEMGVEFVKITTQKCDCGSLQQGDR